MKTLLDVLGPDVVAIRVPDEATAHSITELTRTITRCNFDKIEVICSAYKRENFIVPDAMESPDLTDMMFQAVQKKLGASLARTENRLWNDMSPGTTGGHNHTISSDFMMNPSYGRPSDYLPSWTVGLASQGANMAIPAANGSLSLFEVYITDRRYTDEHHNGVLVEHVRAANVDDARLKSILRNGFGESDIKFLDFGIQRRVDFVQPIDDDAESADTSYCVAEDGSVS